MAGEGEGPERDGEWPKGTMRPEGGPGSLVVALQAPGIPSSFPFGLKKFYPRQKRILYLKCVFIHCGL